MGTFRNNVQSKKHFQYQEGWKVQSRFQPLWTAGFAPMLMRIQHLLSFMTKELTLFVLIGVKPRYHTFKFKMFYGFKDSGTTLLMWFCFLWIQDQVPHWCCMTQMMFLHQVLYQKLKGWSQRHPKIRNWSSLHWTAILQFIHCTRHVFSRQPKVIKRTGMTQLTPKVWNGLMYRSNPKLHPFLY